MAQTALPQQRAIARLRHLLIPARKVRLICDLLRGMSVDEAEAHLQFLPQHAARPILKLLRSASKNGELKGLDPRNLFISKILVDDGPISKRWMQRARGSASPLYKRSSHVTVELALIDRERRLKRLTGITIKKEVPQDRKFKELEEKEKLGERAPSSETKKEGSEEDRRETLVRSRRKKEEMRFQKRGFLPKMFRRKSV